jgi:hypothetical protein
MLNPDGVIIGNYRCNNTGHDLNRQWAAPSGKLFPENFAVKAMMRKTIESREIYLYCDFHGHSRARNLFIYGCSKDKKMKERIFPMLYAKKCENFNYENCSFAI